MKKIVLPVVLTLFFGFMLAGCQKKNQPSISISPTEKTIASGNQLLLTVTAKNTDIQWPDPASVAGTYITNEYAALWTPPLAAGTYEFTVTATDDPEKTATATVIVTAPEPIITLAPKSASLNLGATRQLSATIVVAAGQPEQSATWAVTDTCGSITQDGLFTATQAGSCTVTASITGNSGQIISDTAIMEIAATRSPLARTIKSYVSPIDATMKSHLQAIMETGLTQQRIPGQLGQWGDSLTYTMAYMAPLSHAPNTTQDGHNYQSIAEWMGNLELKGVNEPANFGNYSGWICNDWNSDASNIIANVNPSWSLTMFGSNEILHGNTLVGYEACLNELVQKNIAAGIIPVLSTLPPQNTVNGNKVTDFNAAVIRIASANNIPYVDPYGLFMELHPSDWATTLLADNMHLSFTGNYSAIGNDETLKNNGYWLRTLLTAEMAEKLKEIVFDNGAPDGID